MIQLLAVLITVIIAAAIGSLLIAFVVQLAASMIFRFKPSYGMAYKAAFLGYMTAIAVTLILVIVGQGSSDQIAGVVRALTPVVVFLAHAFVYGILIRHPQHGAIGIGKGLVLTLAQLLFVTVIGSLILAVLALVA